MVSLKEEQYEWLADTITATKLKGSQIIRALIDKAMQDKAGIFRKELANERVKIRLQQLNDERARIEEECQDLGRQLKSGDRQKTLA